MLCAPVFIQSHSKSLQRRLNTRRRRWLLAALVPSVYFLSGTVFTSSNTALLGCPHCGLSIRLSPLAIFNTLFWVYAIFFFRRKWTTWKYSKSVIFVCYEKGHQWSLGMQSINSESFFNICRRKSTLIPITETTQQDERVHTIVESSTWYITNTIINILAQFTFDTMTTTKLFSSILYSVSTWSSFKIFPVWNKFESFKVFIKEHIGGKHFYLFIIITICFFMFFFFWGGGGAFWGTSNMILPPVFQLYPEQQWRVTDSSWNFWRNLRLSYTGTREW